MEDGPSPEEEVALETLRRLVADCIDKHLLRSAIFFADKLVTLSDGAAEDVFLLAQVYVYNGEHARALALLQAESLTAASPRFVHLTAVCLVATSAWDEALLLLGESDQETTPGCGHAAPHRRAPRALTPPRSAPHLPRPTPSPPFPHAVCCAVACTRRWRTGQRLHAASRRAPSRTFPRSIPPADASRCRARRPRSRTTRCVMRRLRRW